MDVPYGVYICKLIFLRRTCDDWKCLGRCDMYLTLETEFQDYTTTDDIDLVIIKKFLVYFTLYKNKLTVYFFYLKLDDSCELASVAATTSTCYG